MLGREVAVITNELVTGRKHQALCVCSTLGTNFPVTNIGFTHVGTTFNTLACLVDSVSHSQLNL